MPQLQVFLLHFNIPSTLNIGFEIVGCVFAIIIVKQLFGGIGQNFMNPALAARCFLLIAYTGPMTNFVCDAYSGATPLAILKPGSEVVGQTAPTLLTMFIGKTSGVIGETSVICLLIGAIYLVVRKIISLRIPLSYIGTFAVLIFLLHQDISLMLCICYRKSVVVVLFLVLSLWQLIMLHHLSHLMAS